MSQIGYQRWRKPNIEKMANQQISIDNTYQPFNLANTQGYNPIYSRFFEMSEDNYNMIALNHQYQVTDLHTLFDRDGKKIKKDVFVKFSPLLDPLKFITGKYNLKDDSVKLLPSLDASKCIPKISNHHNCSYTDAFFSFLSNMLLEKHGFIHGVPFYGSALAVQNRFRFNLADDLDFVKDSEFFMDNIGKYYTIDENAELLLHEFSGSGSRANRQKIAIHDSVNASIEVDNILDENARESASNEGSNTSVSEFLSLEYEKTENSSNKSPHKSESDDSGGSSCSDETEDEYDEEEPEDEKNQDETQFENEGDRENDDDSNWETETSSSFDYEQEEPVYCYLHDFPVQMIFQEKCNGTLDELLMKKTFGNEEMIATLFQIIMILLTYQKSFDFTHNDLHTNNIMYVSTNQTHINYCFENTWYRVPTYGRIYKLIDFGRAIYRFQDKTFCSDSFAPNGDAFSQYNCEPFFNESKPRLEPNFSFDLCRLGCSLYDFFTEDNDKNSNPLDELIKKWCSDDQDKNVVYKKNGQERYPGFKLYKMIARTVHHHTPKNQLSNPVFSSFIHSGKSAPTTTSSITINIDEIPKYKIR